MRKGQISFDLMLAAVAAIIFVGSIANVAGVMADNARIDSIRSQEKQIANGIADTLISSSVFIGDPANPTSTFKILYKIPEIRTAYSGNPNDCDIQVTFDEIEITYNDAELGPIKVSRPFKMSADILSYLQSHISYNPGPYPKCGGELVINNA